MEIIWGKNEKGKELDLILDVTLRAVIVRDGSKAYVVTADNKRTNDSIIQSQDVESIDFIFSPDRALNSLEYVLLSDEEQEGYEELIGEFQDAFFEEIKRQAEEANKQGDLLRAHQLIFTWKKFNRKGVTINLPTTPSVEVEDEMTKIKGNGSKKMRECLTDLIIKYTLYIAVWEKAYNMNDVARVITNKFTQRIGEIKQLELEEEKRVPKAVRSKIIIQVLKDTEEDEDEREIARELYEEIQQTIQNYSGLKSSKLNFFYTNEKKREEKNRTLYQTVKIAKITDVSQYMNSTGEDFKRILFDELVREKANYSVRLRMCDLLQLGTEIVVFNVIRFNKNIFYKGKEIAYSSELENQYEFFFAYANVMQFQMIPYLSLVNYPSEHKEDLTELEILSKFYDEAVEYFMSDKKYGLLDKSNWGGSENKPRKYLRVRNSYFQKGLCMYTEEKLKNDLTYNKVEKRFEFSDKSKKHVADKYQKFVQATEDAISEKLKDELQKLANNA